MTGCMAGSGAQSADGLRHVNGGRWTLVAVAWTSCVLHHKLGPNKNKYDVKEELNMPDFLVFSLGLKHNPASLLAYLTSQDP